MPDREKVIKGFECCHVMVHDLGPDKTSCGICPYKDVQTEEQIDLGGIECVAVLHDDALSLLKEQEGVVPYIDIDEAKCPVCKVKLTRQELIGDDVLFEDFFDYCPHCGKPVLWEGR